MLIGACLCGFSQNNGIIPVNKNLWTFSFVLVLGGAAFWILTIFYLLVDYFELWSGRPFTFVGMNSILLYLLHEILKYKIPFQWEVLVRTHETCIIQQICAISIWTVYAYFCYKSKFFLSLWFLVILILHCDSFKYPEKYFIFRWIIRQINGRLNFDQR